MASWISVKPTMSTVIRPQYFVMIRASSSTFSFACSDVYGYEKK